MPQSSIQMTGQTALGVPDSYRDPLRDAALPADVLRPLTRIRDGRSAVDVALTVVCIFAVPILCVKFPNPVVLLLGLLVNLRLFNCLAQFVHNSDHACLFTSRAVDRRVIRWCAAFIGSPRSPQSTSAHLQHHLYVNTDKDPDLFWGPPTQTGRQLLKQILLTDMLFRYAVTRIVRYISLKKPQDRPAAQRPAPKSGSFRFIQRMFPVFAAQGLLVLWYAVLNVPAYYLWIYFIPLVTIYPAQARFRRMVEHSYEADYRPASIDDYWVTRSMGAGWLTRFLFSPLAVQYHFEHHLFPQVPYYNLKQLREVLLAYGYRIPTTPGYWEYFIHKLAAESKMRHNPSAAV